MKRPEIEHCKLAAKGVRLNIEALERKLKRLEAIEGRLEIEGVDTYCKISLYKLLPKMRAGLDDLEYVLEQAEKVAIP